MALATLRIAEREPHVRRFRVDAREEPEGVEARDRPNLEAHPRVGAAVTGDAADVRLALVMKSRQVAAGGRDQSAEFLVVEVAGDAEPVVPLFRGECSEEQCSTQEGSDDTYPPRRQAAEPRTADRRSLSFPSRANGP